MSNPALFVPGWVEGRGGNAHVAQCYIDHLNTVDVAVAAP